MSTSAPSSQASSPPKTASTPPLLYEEKGRGDPVLLMPGTLTGWLSWVAHAERLSKGHRVIRAQLRSIELVEAGRPVPEDYSVLTEREALLATVQALGLKRLHLAGWSSGGGIALAFALQYPHYVKTLTLIEPAAFWVLREIGYTNNAIRAAEAADRLWAGKEITIDDLRAFLVRAGLGDPDDDFESHPRWPVMVRNRQTIALGATEWDYDDSLERLRSLQIPILGVKGSETAADLGAMVDAIVTHAPNAEMLELPGDHACHIENIDRFLEAFEAHLGKRPS